MDVLRRFGVHVRSSHENTCVSCLYRMSSDCGSASVVIAVRSEVLLSRNDWSRKRYHGPKPLYISPAARLSGLYSAILCHLIQISSTSVAMASTTKDVRVPRSSAVGYVNTSTIRVVVGGEAKNQTFSVHEGLICSRSDFFKNAMKEPWLEAEERKVSLAEEEPDVFALYLELLYVSLSAVLVRSTADPSRPTSFLRKNLIQTRSRQVAANTLFSVSSMSWLRCLWTKRSKT
jgi:hypothetical protein